VDLFHAREHLHDLARKLKFMLGDRKEEWLTARLEDLHYGYIAGILAATREHPLEGMRKDKIGTAPGYFENNPRTRCHRPRQCGLFAGPGVVEASCKSVIRQRLKHAGMQWTANGADTIITPPAARPAAPGGPPATAPTLTRVPRLRLRPAPAIDTGQGPVRPARR